MLVDLDTLSLTLTLAPHRESLFSCAWSPNGDYLVTAGMDGTLAVTDPRPLRERLPAGPAPPSSR